MRNNILIGAPRMFREWEHAVPVMGRYAIPTIEVNRP
jgi:hypothetical protein